MELRRLLHLVRHRILLVGVLVLVALAAGYSVTPRRAVYRTQATLFVGVAIPSANALFNATAQYGQQLLAATFAAMIPQPSIVQAAIAASGVSRSAGQVIGETKATVVSGTNLIRVSVSDSDPVVAQRLADSVSQAFVTAIAKIDPVSTNLNGTGPTVSPAYVSQSAYFPGAPTSNGLGRNLTLAGIFGLVAAISLVLLLDYLDLSVRKPDDLERQLGLPVLGVIPLVASVPKAGELVAAARTGPDG